MCSTVSNKLWQESWEYIFNGGEGGLNLKPMVYGFVLFWCRSVLKTQHEFCVHWLFVCWVNITAGQIAGGNLIVSRAPSINRNPSRPLQRSAV